MTWTWFEWNDEEFYHEADTPHVHVVVGAPKEVAVRWWKDEYGEDPERVTDDAMAWTAIERDDPDVLARFILGEVTYGGVGNPQRRPAELRDIRAAASVRVVMPSEVAAWAREVGEGYRPPSAPWVPEHVDLPEEAGRKDVDFVPDPFGEDDEPPGKGRNS